MPSQVIKNIVQPALAKLPHVFQPAVARVLNGSQTIVPEIRAQVLAVPHPRDPRRGERACKKAGCTHRYRLPPGRRPGYVDHAQAVRYGLQKTAREIYEKAGKRINELFLCLTCKNFNAASDLCSLRPTLLHDRKTVDSARARGYNASVKAKTSFQ